MSEAPDQKRFPDIATRTQAVEHMNAVAHHFYRKRGKSDPDAPRYGNPWPEDDHPVESHDTLHHDDKSLGDPPDNLLDHYHENYVHSWREQPEEMA